jgi:hypothetical protein
MAEKVTADRRFRVLKLVSHLRCECTCMCAFPVWVEALGLADPPSKEYDKISRKILKPGRTRFRGLKGVSHPTRSCYWL